MGWKKSTCVFHEYSLWQWKQWIQNEIGDISIKLLITAHVMVKYLMNYVWKYKQARVNKFLSEQFIYSLCRLTVETRSWQSSAWGDSCFIWNSSLLLWIVLAFGKSVYHFWWGNRLPAECSKYPSCHRFSLDVSDYSEKMSLIFVKYFPLPHSEFQNT